MSIWEKVGTFVVTFDLTERCLSLKIINRKMINIYQLFSLALQNSLEIRF